MSNLLQHIQSMYELQLYSNVIKVCDLVLTASEQRRELLSLPNKFQIITYYADSLYQTQHYQQAENFYRQSLQIRKLLKTKSSSNSNNNNNKLDNNESIMNDNEIKYKIHLCLMQLKQAKAALEILQSVPSRQRTPKINMALGNLFRDQGMERSAITYYKEVLKECPLSLEAAENLLKLGIQGVEVNTFMVQFTNENIWLNSWLKAQAQLYSRDFHNALQTYKQMDQLGLLKDNVTLLVCMGYCYHYLCDNEKAINILQRALRLDSDLLFGRDLLSTLLVSDLSKSTEYLQILENLTNYNNNIDMLSWKCEHWIVIGNYNYATKKYEKAAYFGHQALSINNRNIEAFLLKARTLFEINKLHDAVQHCTEALQICPYRFDLHQCLIDCYIKMNRLREADTVAVNACKQLNYSPQSLTLHATVLLKDPMTPGKTIKKILQNAVEQDKSFLTNAVYMLAEYLQQEQQYEQAKQLLLKYVEQYPTSKLHQLLGDCFVNLQKDDEAFDHYTTALRLDPANQRASEGLNNLGKSTSKKESYYTCVGESSYTSQVTSASDHEVYAESDTDPWPRNSTFE